MKVTDFPIITPLILFSLFAINSEAQSFFRLADQQLLTNLESYVKEHNIRVVRLSYDYPKAGHFFSEKRSYDARGNLCEVLVSGHEGYMNRLKQQWFPFAYKKSFKYDSRGRLISTLDTIRNYRHITSRVVTTHYKYIDDRLAEEIIINKDGLFESKTARYQIDSLRYSYDNGQLANITCKSYSGENHKRKGLVVQPEVLYGYSLLYQYEADKLVEEKRFNELNELIYILHYSYLENGSPKRGDLVKTEGGEIMQQFELEYKTIENQELVDKIIKRKRNEDDISRSVFYNLDNSIEYIEENGVIVNFSYSKIPH